MGCTTIKNGELLALASRQFDVFVTVDRNLAFQQNFAGLTITVIILQATTSRLADLRLLVPKLLAAIADAKPAPAAIRHITLDCNHRAATIYVYYARHYGGMGSMMLPPKPRNVSFNVRVKGSPPVNELGLSEAQEFARLYIEAGLEVEISESVTGEVIERHPAQTT
jgi:hypothetical protein